jgi:Ca-activated chloride channel family protein
MKPTPRLLVTTLTGLALAACLGPQAVGPVREVHAPAPPVTQPALPVQPHVVTPAAQPEPRGKAAALESGAPSGDEPAKGDVLYEAKAERLVAGGRAMAPAPQAAAAGYAGAYAAPREFNTESYRYVAGNDYKRVREDPLSTFSADVDTASYANVRRFVQGGALPPPDAVRIEELVNYFSYAYPQPTGGEPFGVRLDMAAAPWNPAHRLVRIGLRAKSVAAAARKAANLVFLLDVSGSMADANKLPLVVDSLKLLTAQLTGRDRVSIVVYAGASGLVLPPTRGDDRATLVEALERLGAGGSTNGAEGIELAYRTARESFVAGGVNRVILATDGDFNVGVTGEGDLVRIVQQNAKSGVFLTVLGFGMGNYKDAMLEQLADKGNGAYAYIDSRHEARKVFVEQVGGTLETVAKDVKFQVEFNPAAVSAYRLIGYENRLLQNHEFNDDTVDAGDVGAGHTVTALYELVPAGGDLARPAVDPLKYQRVSPVRDAGDEALTLKIRYKEPAGDTSKLLTYALRDTGAEIAARDADFGFAAAVAAWGMLLRESPHKGTATYGMVLDLARGGLADDAHGHRAEFVSLVHKAAAMQKTAAIEE